MNSSDRNDLSRHRDMLIATTFVAVAAVLLQVRDDGRVTLAGLPAYPLPESCFFRVYLGVRCPACGLTRSFLHLAHGHWHESLRAHRIGWLLALAMLIQFPYRIAAVKNPSRWLPFQRYAHWLGMGLIATLVVNWLLTIAFHLLPVLR